MHRSEGCIHDDGGLIGDVKGTNSLLLQNRLDAVEKTPVDSTPKLQPLLDHVHWRQNGVAHHCGANPRHRMSQVVIRVAAGQPGLAELIDGEVDGMGGAGSEAHGGDAPVEPGRPIRPQN
uniref:Uncharacterized protein n=1 Tax=Opuntia streptacantha TaxID=393608 RepID=A0A7C9ABW3_OPUST